MNVLSTKKLSVEQQEMLRGSGIDFTEYDAIETQNISFFRPKRVKNGIFTSKNAVNALFLNSNRISSDTKIKNCFCVGSKTEALLKQFGQNVVKMELNSSFLGDFLVKNYKNEDFYYFCGTKRREELPNLLKSQNMQVFEVKTYKTELKTKEFNEKWDGIMFFSPSGVQSFLQENSMGNSAAICIGDTTATEAKKFGSNVIVANEPTIEGVIKKTIETILLQ